MTLVKHKFSDIGHYIILALVTLSSILDREKVISDQVHGTIQVATMALGAGWVTSILHNALVQRALAFTGQVGAAAGTAADKLPELEAKLKQFQALAQDVLSAVNGQGNGTPGGAS